MTETLKLILELQTRGAGDVAKVATGLRSIEGESKGAATGLSQFEVKLRGVETGSRKTSDQLTRLRKEIETTHRTATNAKLFGVGGQAAVLSKAASASGAASLAGGIGGRILTGGLVGGVAGIAGVAILREITEAGRSVLETEARLSGLNATLDVLARNLNVSRASFTAAEQSLKQYGLTSTQAREAIRDFGRAGASIEEVTTLVGVALDSAARQGLTLDDSLSRLRRGVLKAEPELLDELGIVLRLSEAYKQYAKANGIANAEALNTSQRSRAIVEALTQQTAIGGEYAATVGKSARVLLDLDQASARVGEKLSGVFSDVATNSARSYLTILQAIEKQLDSIAQRRSVGEFERRAAQELDPGGRRPLVIGDGTASGQDNARAIIRFDPATGKPVTAGGIAVPQVRVTEGLIQQRAAQLQFSEKVRPVVDAKLDQGIARRGLELSKALEALEPDFDAATKGLAAVRKQIALLGGDQIGRINLDRKAQIDALTRGGPALKNRPEVKAKIDEINQAFDALISRVLSERAQRAAEQIAAFRQKSFLAGADSIIAPAQAAARTLLESVQGAGVAQSQAAGRAVVADLDRSIAEYVKRNAASLSDLFTAPIGGASSVRRFLIDAQSEQARQRLTARPGFTQAVDPARLQSGLDSRVRLLERAGEAEARIMEARSRDSSTIIDLERLRLSVAEQVFKITGDTAALDESRLEAVTERQTRIAEIQRQQLDTVRQATGQAFDASISGGLGGLQAFGRSQLLGALRTTAQNAAAELFTGSARAGLGNVIGGQTRTRSDGVAELTVLGRLLQGTPLGVDQTKLNTQSLDLNTIALRDLTASIRSGGPAFGATPSGAAIAVEGIGDVADATKRGADQASQTTQGIKALEKALGVGVFGAAAAGGIISGTQRGGIGGGLQVAGGVTSAVGGVASLFQGVTSALGGVLPFIQAGGIIASLVGGLFGGPDPAKRQREIQSKLDANRFNAPDAVNAEFDTFGRITDTGSQGQPRTYQQVVVRVDAIDGQSVMRYAPQITEAVRAGMRGDGGAFYADVRRELVTG
ncbi:MAG: hypothetical protein GC160_19885 [Acidobacteria bacterium]|nr:hypothetical protein [Acidobacteriota bacterium]